MFKIEDIPEDVVEALRERKVPTWKITNCMSRLEMFREYCEWNGLIGYADSLWEIVTCLKDMKNVDLGDH